MAESDDNPSGKPIGFGGGSLPIVIQTGNTIITISTTKPKRKRKKPAKKKGGKKKGGKKKGGKKKNT